MTATSDHKQTVQLVKMNRLHLKKKKSNNADAMLSTSTSQTSQFSMVPRVSGFFVAQCRLGRDRPQCKCTKQSMKQKASLFSPYLNGKGYVLYLYKTAIICGSLIFKLISHIRDKQNSLNVLNAIRRVFSLNFISGERKKKSAFLAQKTNCFVHKCL